MRADVVLLVLCASIASVVWSGCDAGEPIAEEPITEERCLAGEGIWDAQGRRCVDDRRQPRALYYPPS